MSALDDARAVLAYREPVGEVAWWEYAEVREALAALVAEVESERAQLGELLRAMEAQSPGILPASLRALLAKVGDAGEVGR